ncbi:MAG: DUF559 domain-containing protein, partial [Luteimonas sp.]
VADARRTEYLSIAGFRVLRFWNHDVLNNIEGVIAVIRDSLVCVCPHPSLPPQAGEGAKDKPA